MLRVILEKARSVPNGENVCTLELIEVVMKVCIKNFAYVLVFVQVYGRSADVPRFQSVCAHKLKTCLVLRSLA